MSPEPQPPTHTVFGYSPERPTLFWAPPVAADPSRPLPDAGAFLRVFAGTEEPDTALLRCARHFLPVQQIIYDTGRDAPDTVHEQLTLLTFLIDREAGGYVSGIAVKIGAPTNPSSYGEMVYWLAWKYLLIAMRQDQSAHAEHDAAALLGHCEMFDQLVADVRAGGVRLPERATNSMPPSAVRPDGSRSDTRRQADR
ncbi:hypothetical protein [Nocardia brasiliensis]|uniref:hypothetical protein n=1 Tax=Nocardia brasiliensis TaxID=37326 RepID=UPI003D913EBE